MARLLLVTPLAALALTAAPAATAGPFERIVGVGAHGAWRAVTLTPTGPRSDAGLEGTATSVPRGGYVRVYPFIGGLPAIPGRYYPASHVICLYWHEPVSNCSRLAAAGAALLSPFASLPLRRLAPTVPVAVHYRSHLLRDADGNVFAALELALERPALAPSPAPRHGLDLTVTWRGPRASRLPGTVVLTPRGVYAAGRRFPLQRGPWCYLTENLRNASASLLEATSRICR